LIRSFGLRAEAPKRFTAQTVCPIGLNKQTGCSCDSACLFLYLGAVHRYGDALGVHRLYLNPEIQRKLSLEESKKFAKMLEEATKQYFEEMHAPTSLLDQVNSAASDSVRYLTNDYVELGGLADREVRERESRVCTFLPKLTRARKRKSPC
jgi:hypothetical protein